MPKGEYRAITGLMNLVKMSIPLRSPTDGPADDVNNEVTDPADDGRFEALAASESDFGNYASGRELSNRAISSRVLRWRTP